jgi:phage host-nuclease inhibitor protein Gam
MKLSIKNLDGANQALRSMGLLEANMDELSAAAEKKISAIQAAFDTELSPLQDQYKKLTDALEKYAVQNRDSLFAGAKTQKLLDGDFGFLRHPDSITVSENTASLLASFGLDRFIRTKIEPDKKAMLNLSEETLKKVGAIREQRESFFAKPKRLKAAKKKSA